MAVREVIIKESEMGSIPDSTETPDLLDEMSQQLGIWHPDDGHQDDGYKEEQDTSTAIKEVWHDAESVNTQGTTLRRDASDVEEAALDEESTATKESLRDSESLEDSETEDFSQSETVGFFEEALEQADRAESRRATRARKVAQFCGVVRTHFAVTEGDFVEPKTVYKAKLGDDWDQWYRAKKNIEKQRDLEPSETTHRHGRHTRQMALQSEIGTQWSSGQIQSTLCGERLQTVGRTGLILRLLRLPVSQRHSGFCFNYQRSRAM